MSGYDTHINVRLPAWQVKLLDARRQDGETRSDVIRRLLLTALIQGEPDD